MIMINDMTRNNFTRSAAPDWMRSDHFGTLLEQEERRGLLEQLRALLMHKA